MFCCYCGATLNEESAFCSKCGKPVALSTPPIEESESMPKKHKIAFFRESQTFLFNAPMNIIIDEVRKMSIDNGQMFELNLEEGNHHIKFFQNLRTKNIDIDLNCDIQITIRWSRLTGQIVTDVINI